MKEAFVVRNEFVATRLIDQNGTYHENFAVTYAKKMAQENGMDLVCVNEPSNGQLALCKIVDFGKFKYQIEKQKRKQMSKNRQPIKKELRFSTNIADNDIEHKLRSAKEFLNNGSLVVFSMKLFGRDRSHMDLAEQKMNLIVEKCKDVGKEVGRSKSEDMIIVKMVHVSKSTEKNDEHKTV